MLIITPVIFVHVHFDSQKNKAFPVIKKKLTFMSLLEEVINTTRGEFAMNRTKNSLKG